MPPTQVNSRIVKRQKGVQSKPPKVPGRGSTPTPALTSTSAAFNEAMRKRFEKFGYSKNEVWNWLYTENEEGQQVSAEPQELYSIPQKAKAKVIEASCESSDVAVEVKFSPEEFVTAPERLAHLDLDGFENFVGNTLEKAMLKRRREMKAKAKVKVLAQNEVTVSEIPKHTSLDVKTVSDDPATPSHPQTCQTCIASGESSCSSALSSLESVRSSSGSSGRRSEGVSRSSSGSETLGSELTPTPKAPSANPNGHHNQLYSKVDLRRPPSKPQRLMRLSTPRSSSSELTLTNSKPYQTLEVAAPDAFLDNHNGKA